MPSYPDHPTKYGETSTWGNPGEANSIARPDDCRIEGTFVYKYLPPDEAGEALIWAKETRTGRFPGDAIQREYIKNFYSEIARTGAVTGYARTYKLTCGEDTVATCFGVVDGERYCYLVLACDYENFAQYSPGMLILDLAMADWAATGGKVFDFTIGDEPFKSSFGCTRSPMYIFETDIVRR